MAFDAIQISFGELNMKAEEHILKAVQQIDVNVDKEKLIKAIKATDFVDELIYYIFHVQDADDDNLSAELVCRKLLKHGLIDKVDGYYQTHEIRTNTHECVKDMHDKTSCDTCKHKGEYAYCRLCGRLSENNYEPKDEPQTCSFGLHMDCSLCWKESHCRAIKEAERREREGE